MRRTLTRLLTIPLAAALAACGTVPAPIWESAGTATQAAAARAANATAIALGLPTATPVTPTATFTPTFTATPQPTATFTPTPLPPTATPTLAPTSTPLPTSTPTSAPAEAGAAVEGVPPGFAEQVAAADPQAGAAVFQRMINMPDGSVWMCAQCHSVTPDEQRLIGPGLWNLVNRAPTRVEGQDTLTYIYHSIVYPNEYIVPPDTSGAPYPANLMPQHYGELLTQDELADLIAYLETLTD